ncbi:MAG: RNA polymerase sigma factor [Tepidiformaceae bacterium]
MAQYSLAEDTDLVAAAAQGREAALGVLYDRYHRQCFGFSLRILGSEPDAEEAVQETFVRVWRGAPSYDLGRTAVGSWILSITHNLCIDELRRRRRRVQQSPALEASSDMASSERTDDAAEQKIMGEQIRQALQALPGEQRSAIELIYFHGLSSQEVGRILGVPAPTVRSRLRLGLLRLGGVLQSTGVIVRD